MENKLLELKDVRVKYHTLDYDVMAVNGVSLELNKGESLGLVGETGAGKTTLALSILGLLPKGVEQLLMAGRCVSADSTAAGAIRVMPPCMGMGQAAGIAAALAVKEDTTVRKVDAQNIRKVLKENGAYL